MDFLEGMDKIDVPEVERDKKWAFATLRRRGVSRVEVTYSGGGDSGSVDDVTAFGSDGSIVTWDEPQVSSRWDYETRKHVYPRPLTEDESLYLVVSETVYDIYGSFAGEYTVNGKVVWNVVEGTVTNSGTQEVFAYNDYDDQVWSEGSGA